MIDHADILWRHMQKQAEADLPPAEEGDAKPEPIAAVVGVARCLRCGAVTSAEQCRECGFCVGCEGGCAA